jgi:hypothetical protein
MPTELRNLAYRDRAHVVSWYRDRLSAVVTLKVTRLPPPSIGPAIEVWHVLPLGGNRKLSGIGASV